MQKERKESGASIGGSSVRANLDKPRLRTVKEGGDGQGTSEPVDFGRLYPRALATNSGPRGLEAFQASIIL